MQQSRVERILKRSLKKGRLRVTQSLLIAFLITGSVLQAASEEKLREEKEVLLFINGMIQNGGGSGSHQKVSKKLEKPDRPTVKPITPEVDPQRPLDDFDPITPEVDLQRPINGFDPITPEIKPQRPIDDFDPITPEVNPTSIIIWKNGEEIRGTTYTLSGDLSVLSLEDGLRTTIGEIINEATIAIDTNSNSGMMVLENGIAINKGDIVVNNAGSDAMVSEDGGTLINEGTILNKGGMAGKNSTLINETSGTISILGDYLTAMKAAGGEAINKGTIILGDKSTMRGIDVSEGGTGTNQGTIELYASGLGMEAGEGSTVTNEGAITGYAQTTAMNAFKGTALNKGTVTNSKVTASYGGTAINEETGIITINSDPQTAMLAQDGEIINNGIINANFEGMTLEYGATGTNEGTITITDSGGLYDTGIKAMSGSTGVNKGVISGEAEYGMLAEDSTIINESNITAKGTGMYGIKDSTVLNKGQITTQGVGMFGSGEKITLSNEKDITLLDTTKKSMGMRVENKGTATNNGTIAIWSEGSGMYEINGTLINSETGEIDLIGNAGTGMTVNSGSAINDGKINSENNELVTGIMVKAGEAINNGTISLSGKYWDLEEYDISGMAAEKGTIVNKGQILTYLTGHQSSSVENLITGMRVTGVDSTAVNQGEIRVGMADVSYTAGEAVGMLAKNGANATNEDGIMLVRDHSTGLKVEGENSIVVNEGSIFNSTTNVKDNLIGIYATEGGRGVNKSLIDFTGSKSIGMLAENNGAIINESTGVINVAGSGVGMKITSNSTGINKGTININGDLGTGIYVDSTSFYLNTGTINIKEGVYGSQKIIAEEGAEIVNSGTIQAKGTFETGEGKFIMSSGGTLEADSVKSDIYASGALARGDFEDTYSTYKMLKTNNLEGNVYSNSAVFNAEVTKNADENGYYDVELVRKDFNELMTNGEIGEILEKNYKDTGNELKKDYYDALKLLSTTKQLDKAANGTFGIGYYEGMAKQSLDTVKTTRNVIKKNIFTEAGNRSVGDVIAIGGMDASTIELDSSGNFTGYDYDLYSIYFGVDKQIASEWRIGVVGTLGKGEADYDNANDKEDDIYQGTFYALYEDDFKVNTMLYLGQIDSNLERNVNFADWNKKYEDKINTKFIGLDTAISKRYNLNNFYIEPKAELNTTYFKQGGVHEQREGGVSIDSQDYYSIETGIGGAIEKTFLQEKLAIEGSMMFYTELGDPYKDQESKVNDLFEGDKVKINSYQGNDYYADLGFNMSYKVTEPLKINLGGSYITGEEEDNWDINIGLKYVM